MRRVSGASHSVVEQVIAELGENRGLEFATPHELRDQGCSKEEARRITNAFRLATAARRHAIENASHPVRSRAAAADAIRLACGEAGAHEQEAFVMLGLDARQQLQMTRVVALGTLSHVDVHPRDVFRPAIRASVHSVILGHNHPSGDPSPTMADIQLTRRFADVGRMVGIPVADHIIVTASEHVSLAERGIVQAA